MRTSSSCSASRAMAYKIRYAPAFKGSLDAALGFLDETDSSGNAARRLLAELKEVGGYLAAFPNMYAVREDESREVGRAIRVARVASYLLYYVVVDEDEEVILYTLRHQLADVDGVIWPALGEK